MSARGSTAKISSLRSMSPPALASRVCTLTFILAFLAFVGARGRLRAVLSRLGLFIVCSLGSVRGVRFSSLGSSRLGGSAGFLFGSDRGDFLVARKRRNFVNRGVVDQAGYGQFRLIDLRLGVDQARRIWRAITPLHLHRIADAQPAALVTRDRALDEQEAADRIGADDLKILLGPLAGAHVAGHLLVLEDAARILAVTGRTVRPVRNRDAVGGAEAAEIPALHGAGEALALGHAGNVHQLARNEMVRADTRADIEQRVFRDAELGDTNLGLDLGLTERAA